MKLALVLALVLVATGCASSIPPPPRAPTLTSPADALPPDLDLVVRIDLAAVRAALGPTGLELMRRGTGALPADPGTLLVTSALERTTTAYLALRPELIPGEADNVLVLSGRFAELGLDLALPKAGWSSSQDLGGDVRRFERKSPGGRASPARLYVFGSEQLVFVSPAEIDSVEAVIERGMAPSSLKPRESGVLAFAARLRALHDEVRVRYPSLSGALGQARGLEGKVEATPDGLGVELSLELPSEVAAQRSAEALARVQQVLALAEGKAAQIARSARAEAVGRYVVVRFALERGVL